MTVDEPVPMCKDSVREPTLKRGRDQKENGMTIESMHPSKRLAVDKSEAEKLVRTVAQEPNSKRESEGFKEQDLAGNANAGVETESPNTSSHSSSPEVGPLRPSDPASLKVV